MKRILILLTLLIVLTGCGITGKVVEEVKEQQTQEEKDTDNLIQAISEEDVSICYDLQTQNIREECFKSLAKDLHDPSICNNLLGRSLRDDCKEDI